MINEIHCGDNLEILPKIPDNSIDLMLCSPPYDQIREYGGFTVDLHKVGEECHRVLKDGSVAVMVIADQRKDHRQSLTSFKTAVDWCENIGFGLNYHIIYHKNGRPGLIPTGFRQDHENIFIFIKGDKPAVFDKTHMREVIKWKGRQRFNKRDKEGGYLKSIKHITNDYKERGSVWFYTAGGRPGEAKKVHPAVFPDALAEDIIRCYSKEGGTVLDPFLGSGTTAAMAKKTGRKYIGIDIEPEYCRLARERVEHITSGQLV